jgi:hypothetical protein
MRSALRQPRLGRRRQATDDRTYNLPVGIPVCGAVMNNRFANAQGGSASQYMLVIGVMPAALTAPTGRSGRRFGRPDDGRLADQPQHTIDL